MVFFGAGTENTLVSAAVSVLGASFFLDDLNTLHPLVSSAKVNATKMILFMVFTSLI
jgi:hypothetical protein